MGGMGRKILLTVAACRMRQIVSRLQSSISIFIRSKKARMAAMRHADIDFKRLWPCQPAQTL